MIHTPTVTLITSGALEVVAIADDWVHVRCRSASTPEVIHELSCDLDGWACDCIAWQYRRRCSHVEAAQLIAAPPGQRRLPPAPT